jgi:molybdate transport system ATP-binding protein
MTLSVAVRHRHAGLALDVAFEAPGGVTALFGRSGAGKTSVVNAVAGLLRPDAGRAVVDGFVLFDTAAGLRLPPHRRGVAYVFQEGRLFSHLNVRHNLLYGRWFAGGGGNGGGDVDRVVDMLGLDSLLGRSTGALSGGEKQRVAIGRALLSRPRLLAMDEPLASLDEARKAEILPYLERLRDEGGVPILYVSHAVAEVARLATTVIMIDAGRVARAGPTAEVLAEPDAVPALGVREAGAILTGLVKAQHDDGLTEVAVSAGSLFLPRWDGPVGARLRVRVAAQDVILARDRPVGLSALNILPCRVVSVRLGQGPGAMVRLRAGDDDILARITRRSATALGIAPDVDCYAVVKTVSVAAPDVGRMGSA